MAPDMKRAVLIVGVWCTALTLWLVPAEMLPLTGYDSPRLATEDQAANAIREKANAENALLKRLRLVDSLSARLLSSSTGPVVIDLPAEAGPEDWSMLSEAVRRQVDYLGAGSADMIVGVSFVDTRFGNHPDFRIQGRSSDYFSGTVEGRPFCLVSYPFSAADPTEPRSRGNLTNTIRVRTNARFSNDAGDPPNDVLGPCSFFLVHGSPK